LNHNWSTVEAEILEVKGWKIEGGRGRRIIERERKRGKECAI
jgi:hypothetical protein